jgi:hypothetical protein
MTSVIGGDLKLAGKTYVAGVIPNNPTYMQRINSTALAQPPEKIATQLYTSRKSTVKIGTSAHDKP